MSLSDYAKRFRDAMSNADTGPLIIASEVVELSEKWDDYRAEAGNLKFTAWLTREMGSQGRGLGFFKKRHEAVIGLGEHIRRSLNHEVAVYIWNSVPEDKKLNVVDALTQAYARNSKCPLTYGQAAPIINGIVGKAKQHKVCHDCVQKDYEIVKLKEMLGMRDAAE
jgi:hypothetical protein